MKYKLIYNFLYNIFPIEIVYHIIDIIIYSHNFKKYLCECFLYDYYNYDNSIVVSFNSCYIEYCSNCFYIILLYYGRKNILWEHPSCKCLKLENN
jgi:hypothetical protein